LRTRAPRNLIIQNSRNSGPRHSRKSAPTVHSRSR
jgi:hypothetical protein